MWKDSWTNLTTQTSYAGEFISEYFAWFDSRCHMFLCDFKVNEEQSQDDGTLSLTYNLIVWALTHDQKISFQVDYWICWQLRRFQRQGAHQYKLWRPSSCKPDFPHMNWDRCLCRAGTTLTQLFTWVILSQEEKRSFFAYPKKVLLISCFCILVGD